MEKNEFLCSFVRKANIFLADALNDQKNKQNLRLLMKSVSSQTHTFFSSLSLSLSLTLNTQTHTLINMLSLTWSTLTQTPDTTHTHTFFPHARHWRPVTQMKKKRYWEMKQIVTDTTTTTTTTTINQSNVYFCWRHLMRIKYQSKKKLLKIWSWIN